MSDGVTNLGTSIAAFSVENVIGNTAGRAAGIVVQPVVWIVTDADPDAVDWGLYGLGSIATAFSLATLGFAAAATGVVKGFVDDDTQQKLDEIRNGEPAQYRPFIGACVDYSGWAGQTINAMTIASRGGTAWQHPNGLWAFIADANGRLIADYQPVRSTNVYQPELPLRASGNGFVWSG